LILELLAAKISFPNLLILTVLHLLFDFQPSL
jgi:hypothetical protein